MAMEPDLIAGDDGVQCRDEVFPATDYERGTVGDRFSAPLQCVRRLREPRAGDGIARGDPRLEELEQSSRLLEQTLIVSRRQRDQVLAILRLGDVRGVRVLLDGSMRVGTAETERAHPGAPWLFPSLFVPGKRPSLVSPNDVERAAGQID